jgi:flagellar hook protein FlgE
MGLTSALYSGLSGLDTSGMQFEVIGNNIANVNTTGYKARRVMFQTQFSRTLSMGSLATGDFGGTNPMQIGLGTKVAQIDTDFTMGSVSVTGINSDLTIEGDGFFILQDETGQNTFSRNGAFSVNNQGYLVSSDGKFIQGYQVDSSFNLIQGALGDINVPLGFLTIARATDTAVIQGNLNSQGEVAATGSKTLSMELVSTALGAACTDDTLLTSVRSATDPATPLFAVGDVITIEGVRGGRTQPIASFTVDATSRLGASALVGADNQFSTFMERALGIDKTGGAPGSPGVTVLNVAGDTFLQITGNYGTQNAITMSNTAIRVNTTDAPFSSWTATQEATGESVYTSFTVYDSLGTPLTMDVTFVKESATVAGTSWRFYATSADDTDVNLVLGNGTIQFDTTGQYVTSTGTNMTIDRASTGAVTPQSVELDLTTMTSLAAQSTSEIALSSQNGVPIGTLSGFGVGADGVITGTFTNGLTQTLGQVALATFANPKGLLDAGDSTYVEGPNSGVAIITAPQQMSAGSIQAGSLELSNVDLSKEFVNLITTSTGFSANSRVITTADEMMQEILQMVR